jgi:pimeloyl-ACP methyl ester carboxylesterase
VRRDVNFDSEGITCRGWLYSPGRGGISPAVVMAHGFSAVKEMRLYRIAEVFADAGLACLVFDYRGFGASDGAPRLDIDPQAQLADYRNAISAARAMAEIDGTRIGVWGSSYSGSHALMLGAIDARVRAVVSQVPMIDGWESFGRLSGVDGRADLVAQLTAERERIYAGGTPAVIPVVTQGDDFAALPTPDAWEWFQATARIAPAWRNQVTLRSLDRLLDYGPGRFIDRIAPTPLLLIAAAQDFLPLDIAERAFAQAGEPKKMVVLDGGHFCPYEPPHFAAASREACDWFVRHLM